MRVNTRYINSTRGASSINQSSSSINQSINQSSFNNPNSESMQHTHQTLPSTTIRHLNTNPDQPINQPAGQLANRLTGWLINWPMRKKTLAGGTHRLCYHVPVPCRQLDLPQHLALCAPRDWKRPKGHCQHHFGKNKQTNKNTPELTSTNNTVILNSVFLLRQERRLN